MPNEQKQKGKSAISQGFATALMLVGIELANTQNYIAASVAIVVSLLSFYVSATYNVSIPKKYVDEVEEIAKKAQEEAREALEKSK